MLAGKGLLTPVQSTFMALFAGLPDQRLFYLTGGTALSEFFLGHRLSFDLDFFTSEDRLILPSSYQVEEMGPAHGLQIRVVRRFATYVLLEAKGGNETLAVDLALDSPFHFAHPLLSSYGVWVNAFDDLKVDKLLAYYGRSEPRDAVDLYFILREVPLDVLLTMAAKKDPGFDLYWFAVALEKATGFPDELDRWPVRMLRQFDPADLKRSFHDLAVDLLDRAAH